MAIRDEYVVHPKMQVKLGAWTISILDPIDDLVFLHGAAFEINANEPNSRPDALRQAWTMRWLQSAKDFYAAPEKKAGLRLQQYQVDAMHALKKRKARKQREPGHIFGT